MGDVFDLELHEAEQYDEESDDDVIEAIEVDGQMHKIPDASGLFTQETDVYDEAINANIEYDVGSGKTGPKDFELLKVLGKASHNLDDVTGWQIDEKLKVDQSRATCCGDLGVLRNVVTTLWKQFRDRNSGPLTWLRLRKGNSAGSRPLFEIASQKG
ncbi:hypothetical protein TNCV_1003961 [Trichonephila clavipes]|nr:hypothetical protein TNCV_1003961 [Trichonephila clavipes]